MRRLLLELFGMIAIGGLIWAAFALLIKLPEHPSLISIKEEQKIGKKYADFILTLNNFSEFDSQYANQALIKTAEKLHSAQENPGYRYNIILVNNEMVNAFALPGGYIIITRGLVNFCDTPEELIAVISHEIGHIEKKHIINRLLREIGLELLTSGDPFVTGEIARTLLSSGYNRKQEEEADLFACSLLLKCSIEPRTLASFFRRLAEDDTHATLKHFEIISSHPNLNKRIKEVLSFPVPEDFKQQETWFSLDSLKTSIDAYQSL